VVLVGVQFPVAGLGGAPDGGGPLGTPASVADDPGEAVDTTATERDPGVTTDLDRGPATTTRNDETATPDDETATPDDETETPMPTATDRATTSAAGAESESGGGGLLEILGAGAAVVVALVCGYVSLTRTRRHHGLFRDGARVAGGLPVVGGAVSAVVGGAGRGLSALPRRTMQFVIGASASAPRVLDAVGGAVGEVAGGLRVAVGSIGGGVGRALLRAPAGLASGLAGLGRSFGGGLLAVPSGVTSMFDGLRSDGTELREDRPAADARSANDVDPEEPTEPDPPGSVTEAWERMLEAARLRRHETKTPVEVARTAVRRGLPAEPVGRLTNLFRRVRYGGEGGSGALATARESLADIEDTDGGEES
jgi:hypothetical protein